MSVLIITVHNCFEALENAVRSIGKTWVDLPPKKGEKENVVQFRLWPVATSADARLLLQLNGFESWREAYRWVLRQFHEHAKPLSATCPHFSTYCSVQPQHPFCYLCDGQFSAERQACNLSYALRHDRVEIVRTELHGGKDERETYDVLPATCTSLLRGQENFLLTKVCSACIPEFRAYVDTLPAHEWKECKPHVVPYLLPPLVKIVAQYAFARTRKACMLCWGMEFRIELIRGMQASWAPIEQAIPAPHAALLRPLLRSHTSFQMY